MSLWELLILLNNIGEIANKNNSLKDWAVFLISFFIFFICMLLGIVLFFIILYYATIFYLKLFVFLLEKLQLLYKE